MSALTQRQLAEEAATFLESPLGEAYLTALSSRYNDLHHQAEDKQLSMEQKAFQVERAAGVKVAIDWLMDQKAQLDAGLFEKDDKAPK